jgi:hypothetical protein
MQIRLFYRRFVHKLGFINVGEMDQIINILLIIKEFISQDIKKSKLNTTLTEMKQMEKMDFLKYMIVVN